MRKRRLTGTPEIDEKPFLLPYPPGDQAKADQKRIFPDPVIYNRLRKEDVHHPPFKSSGALNIDQFRIADTAITALRSGTSTDQFILFCHGGAFIYGPVRYHWDAAKNIATAGRSTVWMVDYPKAPEHRIDRISENIDQVYQRALKKLRGKRSACWETL